MRNQLVINIFLHRGYKWTFFGVMPSYDNDPESGFIATRFQRSGLIKLTGVAGNLRSILKGLDLLSGLNKPVWGAVSEDIGALG